MRSSAETQLLGESLGGAANVALAVASSEHPRLFVADLGREVAAAREEAAGEVSSGQRERLGGAHSLTAMGSCTVDWWMIGAS